MLKTVSKLVHSLCYLSMAIALFSSASFSQEISIDAANKWFKQHKLEMMSLQEVILRNPAIHWVDPRLRLKFIPKYDEFDSETLLAYQQIKKTLPALGILTVNVSRLNSRLEGEIISITYKLAHRGLLAAGGEALTVEYIPNRKFVTVLDTLDNIMQPLDLDGWYTVVHREGVETKT